MPSRPTQKAAAQGCNFLTRAHTQILEVALFLSEFLRSEPRTSASVLAFAD